MADSTDGDTRIIQVTRVVKIPLPDNLKRLASLSAGAIGTLILFATDPIRFLDEVVFGGILDVLVAFGKNPIEFTFNIINLYILGGIFAIFNTIAAGVLGAFDIIVGALVIVRELLVGAFGAVGVDIIGGIVGFQQSLVESLSIFGPAAPIVLTAIAVAVMFLIYRVGVALLGELPIGSSIVDLLGLR